MTYRPGDVRDWLISCSADILINRNWQNGGISSFDTSRNTEIRLRLWLIVVSPRGRISSNASGCPGFSCGSPYANTSGEMISLEVRWAFPWNPTSSIRSPQRRKALSCSPRANSTVRPLFSSASKLRVPSCCAAALKNDRIAEWHLSSDVTAAASNLAMLSFPNSSETSKSPPGAG